MKQSLKLRLIVTGPLSGVFCAMQRGKDMLLQPTVSANALTFDFSVQVDLARNPIGLTGEFAQGPPDKRFVYVNSGTYAGQFGSSWSRRAKVPITGITAALAEEAIASDGILQASVSGIGKDGGPFCASVRLLTDWALVDAGS